MILVTGSKGQLGSEIKKILPEALYVDIKDLDITKEKDVLDFVAEKNVDLIINCAAYTDIDKAETEQELCQKINVFGPATLARSGAKIIHISTNFVFDGTNYKPYTTQDFPTPNTIYGKTKAAGEYAVLEGAKTAIVIRTSRMFSAYGNNFVKKVINWAKEHSEINAIDDQIANPTYAADLAKTIVKIIPQLKDGHKGIYHYANEGVCSWYDFAAEIIEQAGLKCKVTPVCGKEFKTNEARPYYSLLDKSKIKEDFGIKIPNWKESLKKCISQLK